MPTTTGRSNNFRRFRTGLYGLDALLSNRSTGEVGFPTQVIVEIYGYPGTGKSTLTQFLAAAVCTYNKSEEIRALDLETSYDESHLLHNIEGAGFNGTFAFIDTIDKKGNLIPHETLLEELATSLRDPKVGAAILDSVGMVMSQAEIDNPIGSANWGKRAMIINQTCRKAIAFIRGQPKIFFLVNHQYAAMGGKGHTTPGGDGMKFAAALRLTVWKAETFANGAFAMRVKAEKMRYGGIVPKATALIGIVPGMGVSRNMTMLLDALDAKLLERDSRGFVRIDGKSIGRIGKLIEDANKDELFVGIDQLLKEGFKLTEEEDGDDE